MDSRMLWEIRSEIAEALMDIFASSLALDVITLDWRITNIVPLFKNSGWDKYWKLKGL